MTDVPREGLREVAAARAALDSFEARLVAEARLAGSTWAELAEDLSLTAAGVRRRHLQVDPIFARRPQKPQTIDEYHAEIAAALRARGITPG